MLWYKSWLETRWRFLIGFVLLVGSAATLVFLYPELQKLVPLASSMDLGGSLGGQIKEGAELAGSYGGYVWSQWFRQNLRQTWTVFAVLIGTGGLLAQTSGGAALFTLSMPVSRSRLLGVRAATGLLELLGLAVIPSLVLTLLSPAVGQTYSVVNALIHGLCLFVGGAVFFSMAFLLSTVFSDLWRPALITVCIWAMLATVELSFPVVARHGLLRVMTAESYFRAGALPWLGLLVSAAASGAMLYGASVNIARRDF
jgi:hypothetical protein